MRDFLSAVMGRKQRLDEGRCQVIMPPDFDTTTNKTTVFLAGSIENGTAEPWQTQVITEFAQADVCFLNPRRESWDATWKQDISNDTFRDQVDWELDKQDDADIIVMYFDPKTKAPITLMELGLAAALYPDKLIVACPEGYWRKGNVQIVCERYHVTLVDSLEEMMNKLQEAL